MLENLWRFSRLSFVGNELYVNNVCVKKASKNENVSIKNLLKASRFSCTVNTKIIISNNIKVYD